MNAPCAHAATCGGCAFQTIAYEDHLAAKVAAARAHFAAAGVVAEISDPPPVPPAARSFYRNRMDHIVGPGPVIGLRERGRWDAIVDLHECHLLSLESRALLDATRAFLRDRALAPYDLRVERGLVRYVVVREGKRTGHRFPIALVTDAAAFPFEDFWTLARAHGCTGAALAVNAERSDVSRGEVVATAGIPLVERVGRFEFELEPFAFFQPSTDIAEALVERAGAHLAGRDGILLDLYCGAGLFAVSLHERFSRVIAVESTPASARGARVNAARAGASNIGVREETVEAALLDPRVRGACAIVDPPRAGLGARAIAALAASSVETLVYISCNPASLARDIAALGGSFRLASEVALLDSLPWTGHLEAVVKLGRP